ncbi:hypothetical protein PR202_gb22842 [Eleusine coracana subsp. coracana]|uniref:F-box domain-containing protein n=1 Tax=Eleusine coracana subsp. coracana TaxID=191504 RepID=A0AAV5FEU1_ELECO|nr:hypothetical protein PR202_gb22842 [Eleusine coracana subsp. coracana]
MEKEGRRRRRKISKKRKRNQPSSAEPTGINDLTDDLLDVVLLGLDSPVCLVRAASTCKRWCRVVSDAAFLRRFRSLHPPRHLGHFYNVNNDDLPCSFGWWYHWPKEPPVYVPTPASTDAGIKSLSIDFVPFVGGPPEIVDSLLLLLKEKRREPFPNCGCCDDIADYFIPDLVVCEPSTRRYQKIDPPEGRVCILSAFLLDRQCQ